ncbi:MAG: DUF3379 domain-containing protein [Xanthomonadales bacterium]|nr:DUF3379 domain-containing protein [Xanthomonadales bacterium]MDH4018068.1 DUF3379 domain-containing protein [Xanthomonadales bacterium]
MSMNFSEFKKLIGADPGNTDPETLRARKSSPEFEEAAIEAEVFEEKLNRALHIQPPADLLDQIKGISQQPVRKRNWVPLALAASLLVFVGAAGLVWKQSNTWDSVESYVADHYSHDGNKTAAKAIDYLSDQEISKILAKLDAKADQELAGRIKLIKFCPTPDGRGAHMVVSTDQGPVTIFYMPKTQVTDGEMVEFDQMHALLVSLEHGSAAIIGEQSQNVENLVTILRNSLKTGLVDV